jgi:fatty acid desaturase
MSPFFRYREDRPRVAFFAVIAAIDLCVYAFVRNPLLVVLYCALSMLPKGMTCAFNHHHQHLPTFHHTFLNRALEIVYALQTGVTSHTWTLHHSVGHHLNYLDQTLDESRWLRKDATPMGRVEYSFVTFATSYFRAWQAGRNYPKYRKVFLVMSGLTAALVGLLVFERPLAGIAIFLITPAIMLFATSWATYDHHRMRPVESKFEASTNVLQPLYNKWTGNLGYHTAHHYRPSLHWTKLPKLHESIADKVPQDAYLPAGWPWGSLDFLKVNQVSAS